VKPGASTCTAWASRRAAALRAGFLLASVLALLGGALSGRAHAHESPHGLSLVFATPDASATPIVLTNRGLLFPSAAGPSRFRLRCNESYGVNTSQVPHALLDADGALVLASVRAVERTDDAACSFQPSRGLPDLPLGGFAQLASAPNRLLTSTQVYEQPAKLFASEDYGRTWSELATNHTFAVYESLLASADGQQLFAAGHRYDMPTKKLLSIWGASSDGGKTWVDRDLTSDRFPLGFHPTDPKVVFAREPVPMRTIDPRDRLLRSSDGGLTFEVMQELPPISSFGTTPDGASIWLGSQTHGLWLSQDGGKTFTREQQDQIVGVYCLLYRAERLWACTRMAPNTGGVWSSDDRGATWNKLLSFEQVTEEVSCAGDREMLCVQPWRDWTYELLTDFRDAGTPDPAADGGTPDGAEAPSDGGAAALDAGLAPGPTPPSAQVDAGAGPKTASGSDEGCSAAPTNHTSWSAALSLLALLTLARRRRSV
jgi:MYXO-CTERM domain-containing protein